MNDFDRGYIIGLIEGEGTITLQIQKKKAKHGISITINPAIHISNTCKGLLEEANKVLKSPIYPLQRKENQKPAYRLQVWSIEKVKSLLEEFLPRLICKRRQAELVIEFCNIRIEKKEKNRDMLLRRGCAIWGEGYGKREFDILKEIRWLNVPKAGNHSKEFFDAIEAKVKAYEEGYNARINAKKQVTRNCKFCNKQFKIDAVRPGHSQPATFCSRKCNGLALRARQLGLTYEQARVKWIDKLRPIIPLKHEEKIFSE